LARKNKIKVGIGSSELPVYTIMIAARLAGLHPQTLRKYEKAGLVSPKRQNRLRMYSENDIRSLRLIRYLSEDLGINIAGIKRELVVRAALKDIKKFLGGKKNKKESARILSLLDHFLMV
jgi:DNA-binding transcriptional MerR regulator